LSLPQHESHGRLIVGDRLGIGHCAQGGEPSGGGGASACFDGLDVLASRFTQVAMHIDESGADDGTGAIENVHAVGNVAPEILLGDAATDYQQVPRIVDVLRRIDNPAVGKQ
jgi:hypothetical protein